MPLLVALAVLALLLPCAGASAKPVRVFAMGPKLDLSWLESGDTFRGKLDALFDAKLRTADRPAIQQGADDAASHLFGGGRDLVTWPEDIGLFAALTGPRARPARESGSLEGSIAALLAAYAPQIAFYGERHPALMERVPQTRALALALTDTFGRVVLETFAAMADRHDVWLATGVIMAQDWQIVCADRAATPGCTEEDAGKVARLRDPFEPGRPYAYEATTDKPSTMALVFDPSGRLVSKQVKTYYVPLELGAPEGQTALDLVPGAVSDGLSAVRTPVGTLGFVTSKDAWMPDVLQKLDQRGVDLLVQPEFFVDSLVGAPGMWNPDVLIASGYADVLRHPSIEAMVTPELVGNLFSFSADHQQLIAVKPRTGREPAKGMVGQAPQPGLVDVSPWVVPDRLPGEEALARRRRLADAGRKLAPGSGVPCPDASRPGPCENGHVEGVLWRDVEIARDPPRRRFRGSVRRTRFSPSRGAAPSRHRQRNAAVSLRGRHGVLAFEERRAGRDVIRLVRTRDGGRTWSRPVDPTRAVRDAWWPAVAQGPGGRVTVAWVDHGTGRPRVLFARSGDGGRTFAPPVPIDASPAAGVAQWRPALAAGPGDLVHVAWIDERTAHPDGGLPQAGLWYTRIRAGRPEGARRLDDGTPVPLALKLDNAWAPTVAARGREVLVSWIDFQGYDWDVLSRLSTSGGDEFAGAVPVNDTPAADEALNDSPSAVLAPSGPLVAWTDWRKRQTPDATAHPAYDIHVARPGGANRQVDGHGARPVSAFAPSACVSRGRVLVAFQDASAGQNDIRLADVADGRAAPRPVRVDDAGRLGGNAWRPRLACSGRRQLIAWEDERDGPPQIYVARR